jgi:HK97 gp10 family phage protein
MADYVPNNRKIQLEGFSEFEAQLKALGDGFKYDAVARNTLVKAAEKAMQPVMNTAQALAGFNEENTETVHMRDTIRINGRIPNGKDKQSNYINETDAAIAVVSVKKSAVSLAQEFGTSRMPMHPFLRPALDTNAENVLSILKTELASIIPAYAAKLGRRRKK